MIDVKNASNNGMNCLNGSYPLTLSVNPRIKGMEIYDINTIYSKYKEFIDSNCTVTVQI